MDQLTCTCLRKFNNDDRLAEHSLIFSEQSKQVSFTACPATDLNWNIFSKCGHGFYPDTNCAEDILMRYYVCIGHAHEWINARVGICI